MSVALRVDSKMGYAFYVDYVDLFVVKCYNYNKKEKDILNNYPKNYHEGSFNHV